MTISKLSGHRFEFTVRQEDDGCLLPDLKLDGEEVGFTQGRTDYETLAMIADCYACHLDIEAPWYDRWFAGLKRFFDLP